MSLDFIFLYIYPYVNIFVNVFFCFTFHVYVFLYSNIYFVMSSFTFCFVYKEITTGLSLTPSQSYLVQQLRSEKHNIFLVFPLKLMSGDFNAVFNMIEDIYTFFYNIMVQVMALIIFFFDCLDSLQQRNVVLYLVIFGYFPPLYSNSIYKKICSFHFSLLINSTGSQMTSKLFHVSLVIVVRFLLSNIFHLICVMYSFIHFAVILSI